MLLNHHRGANWERLVHDVLTFVLDFYLYSLCFLDRGGGVWLDDVVEFFQPVETVLR